MRWFFLSALALFVATIGHQLVRIDPIPVRLAGSGGDGTVSTPVEMPPPTRASFVLDRDVGQLPAPPSNDRRATSQIASAHAQLSIGPTAMPIGPTAMPIGPTAMPLPERRVAHARLADEVARTNSVSSNAAAAPAELTPGILSGAAAAEAEHHDGEASRLKAQATASRPVGAIPPVAKALAAAAARTNAARAARESAAEAAEMETAQAAVPRAAGAASTAAAVSGNPALATRIANGTSVHARIAAPADETNAALPRQARNRIAALDPDLPKIEVIAHHRASQAITPGSIETGTLQPAVTPVAAGMSRAVEAFAAPSPREIERSSPHAIDGRLVLLPPDKPAMSTPLAPLEAEAVIAALPARAPVPVPIRREFFEQVREAALRSSIDADDDLANVEASQPDVSIVEEVDAVGLNATGMITRGLPRSKSRARQTRQQRRAMTRDRAEIQSRARQASKARSRQAAANRRAAVRRSAQSKKRQLAKQRRLERKRRQARAARRNKPLFKSVRRCGPGGCGRVLYARRPRNRTEFRRLQRVRNRLIAARLRQLRRQRMGFW